MKGTEKQVAWAKDIQKAWRLGMAKALEFGKEFGVEAPLPKEITGLVQKVLDEKDAAAIIEQFGHINTHGDPQKAFVDALPQDLVETYFAWEFGDLD